MDDDTRAHIRVYMDGVALAERLLDKARSERNRALREAANRGYTYQEIADVLGVSRVHVSRQIKRADMEVRPYPPAVASL